MKVLTLFLNFLPMAIIYLIATYSPQVARFSHTCLGKVVALGLILIYSFFDIISGLLVCALIIFYYQSDYVESFQHDSLKEGLESQDSEDSKDKKEDHEENPIDGVVTTEQPSSSKDTPSKSSESPEETSKKPSKKPSEKPSEKPSKKPSEKPSEKKGAPGPPTSKPATENFETLADAYPLPIQDSNLYDKHADMFRQKNCSNGRLMNKGQVVKPEMAEHIFPAIEQDPYHKCNLCDSSCRFKYTDLQSIEKKEIKKDNNNWYIITGIELDLLKPKSSNDEYDNEMKKYHK